MSKRVGPEQALERARWSRVEKKKKKKYLGRDNALLEAIQERWDAELPRRVSTCRHTQGPRGGAEGLVTSEDMTWLTCFASAGSRPGRGCSCGGWPRGAASAAGATLEASSASALWRSACASWGDCDAKWSRLCCRGRR